MSSKNSFFFIGNLGDDPEYKPETGPKDKQGNPTGLTTFSVAVDRKDIGSKDVVDWFDIECWGKLAERCAEYLNKGSKVGVYGRARKDTWKDKQSGSNRSKIVFTARDVQFLRSNED